MTSPACEQLIQNGGWDEGEEGSQETPHWDVDIDSSEYWRIQSFGTPAVYVDTDWYNQNYQGSVYVNLAQGFSRCVGIAYQLSVDYCFYGGFQDAIDDSFEDQPPFEFEISVGYSGSTPISTFKEVFPESNGGYSDCPGSGTFLMLINPLSTPPAPGTDGLSIQFSGYAGGWLTMLIHNVSMTAMSS